MAPSDAFYHSLRQFSLAYIGLGLLELSSNILRQAFPLFHFLLKPMIMISLSVFFFYHLLGKHDRRYYLMQGAILFSLMGDIFLMFEGPLFFQLGLGAFLLAQIGYIAVFAMAPEGEVAPVLRRRPWLVAPFLLYGLGLVFFLADRLGEMRLPVSIYATALTTMAVMALNRWRRVPQNSFAYVFLGALLFVLSDSLIAVDRFAGDILLIPMVEIWIMFTYIAAQYLIVVGMLLQLRSAKSRD